MLIAEQGLTPELVVRSTCVGLFVMGTSKGTLLWEDPDPRGLIAIDDFHISKRLKSYVAKGHFTLSLNKDFEGVMRGCADRKRTWLIEPIIQTYLSLHQMGIAHSVEAWRENKLVGGGYGLAIGSYFALDSMFHREDQASKVAMVHLHKHLKAQGFSVIDCRYPTEHWKRFGAKAVPRSDFRTKLAQTLAAPCTFG